MKWLRRNLKKRFRYAFRHPGYTVKALFHDVMGIDERFLASLVNSTPGAIRGFLNEPSENAGLMRHWKVPNKGCMQAPIPPMIRIPRKY